MATVGCRFSLGMTFSSEAEKDAVKLRVDSARRILFPDESTSQRPDNAALLNARIKPYRRHLPIINYPSILQTAPMNNK